MVRNDSSLHWFSCIMSFEFPFFDAIIHRNRPPSSPLIPNNLETKCAVSLEAAWGKWSVKRQIHVLVTAHFPAANNDAILFSCAGSRAHTVHQTFFYLQSNRELTFFRSHIVIFPNSTWQFGRKCPKLSKYLNMSFRREESLMSLLRLTRPDHEIQRMNVIYNLPSVMNLFVFEYSLLFSDDFWSKKEINC